MSAIFFIVGFGLMVAGVKLGGFYNSRIKRAKITKGQVVAHVRKYTGSRALTPLVKFYLNGDEKYILSSFGSSPPSHSIGENLDVYLDPKKSNRAAVQIGSIQKISIFLMIIGFGTLLVAAQIFRAMQYGSQAFDLIALAIVGGIAWHKYRKIADSQSFQSKWRELKSKATIYNDFVPEEDALKMIDGDYEPEERFGLAGQMALGTLQKNKSQGPKPLENMPLRMKPPETKPKGPSPIFAVLVLVLGMASIVFSIVKAQEVTDFMETATRVPALIIDKKVNHGSGTTYTPIISFSPGPGQNEIQFLGQFGSSHPTWKVGDKVWVLYDPNDPDNAMQDDGLWNYLVSIILGFIGILLIVIGAVNWPSNLSSKRPRRPGEIPIRNRGVS